MFRLSASVGLLLLSVIGPGVITGNTDNDATGVTGYYVSTSATPPAATAAGWATVTSATSYNGSLPYTLTTGDGSKTVYAWYKDAANNVSATTSASIILDQTVPTNGTLTPTTGSTQITLNWSGFSRTWS